MNKLKKVDQRVVIGGLAIMLAALLWSLDGVFIRPKFYEFPAALIVFLEHSLGLIVLSPFIILNLGKIKALKMKDWSAIFWVSIFGGLIGTIFITEAFFAAVNGEVTFATVIILQKLQPIFALIIARVVLREKLERKFYLWALAAIAAAYFLAFGKTGLDMSSLDLASNAAVLAVVAAFAFGSSTVFGKRIVNHLDFKSTAGLRFAFTSLLALGLIIINKDIGRLGEISGIYWGYLFLIVFSSGAAAMFIYYFGLKRVTASTAAICELFWPFSAVLLDYIINKNTLNSLQIIASAILLFAFFKVVGKSKKKAYSFSANIISGRGLGHKLGSPTINLNKIDLDIDYGVYLVEAKIDNYKHQGLLHFGLKETFSNNLSTELYLKEDIKNLGDKKIKIEIEKKIRDIIKFKDIHQLRFQIKKDIEKLED